MSNYDTFALHRNYGPPRTNEDRKAATEAHLFAACDAQREILTIAINAREPFEKWAAHWMNRHFHQVLASATGSFRVDDVLHDWPDAIRNGRSADLYSCQGGHAKPNPGAGTKLSKRSEYFEALVHRYLTILPKSRREKAILTLTAAFGRGEQGRILGERLALGIQREDTARKDWDLNGGKKRKASDIWREDANKWTAASLAKAFFGMLSCNYLTDIARFVHPKSPAGIAINRLVAHNVESINAMIEVNAPAQVQIVKRMFRADIGCSVDDLLQVARDATLSAANRFHPVFGRGGFTTYCKKTIASSMRRHLIGTRVILMPEEKVMCLRKFAIWRNRNEASADSLTMDEQLIAAGITKVGAEEMKALLADEHVTETISVHGLGENASGDGDESNDLASILLTDRGHGATTIRQVAFEDPRLAILRPTFLSLQPLHQALLASLFTCEATDGGEVTWLESIKERSEQVLSAAASRIQSGVASQARVARSLQVTYGA